MVVPAVGKPGWPGCKVSSCTAVTLVTGWASELTPMPVSNQGWPPPSVAGSSAGTKPGCRTKLVMPTPGLEVGLNDMVGIPNEFGRKQCAAVRIVRELISEPVHCEPELVAENRLTT